MKIMEILAKDAAILDLGRIAAAQQRIVGQEQVIEAIGERTRIGQVAQPHGASPDLVLVGRADAAAGGADPLLAAALLAGPVELPVRR